MSASKAGSLTDIPGCYARPGQPDTIYVHLGEILADRGIPDCQEARAAMYGTLSVACLAVGLELIIVAEDGVPNIANLVGGSNA